MPPPNHNSSPRIVVLGDIAVDMIGKLAFFPTPGDDCPVSDLRFHCGGVAANTAVALARWGASTSLVGSVGKDWFGELALRTLQDAGVDVSHVEKTEAASTGLFFIVTSPDGERTMMGTRGANETLASSPLTENCLQDVEALHLVGYSFLSSPTAALAESLIQQMKAVGGSVSFDAGLKPSKLVKEKILEVAAQVNTFLVNRDEAVVLTGEQSPEKAFEVLESTGAGEVVVKLGPQGCLIRNEGKICEVPAVPVKAVNATGAGDAFTALYLWARVQQWPLMEAALLANAAGAAAAAGEGAAESMPEPEAVLRLLGEASLDDKGETTRKLLIERVRTTLETVAGH